MRLGDILFLLTIGAVAGYTVHANGFDRKALDALQRGIDIQTKRSAQIMLQEIDFTFPADTGVKMDELAST